MVLLYSAAIEGGANSISCQRPLLDCTDFPVKMICVTLHVGVVLIMLLHSSYLPITSSAAG